MPPIFLEHPYYINPWAFGTPDIKPENARTQLEVKDADPSTHQALHRGGIRFNFRCVRSERREP